MSTLLETPTRPQRVNKRVVWGLMLFTLLGVLIAAVGRIILVHRMMLPRLAISHPGYVLSVALTPDGKRVLTGIDALDYARGRKHRASFNIPADVFVWDTSSGQLLRRLHGLTVRSNEPSISPDGRRVFATGTTVAGSLQRIRSHVMAWDIASGRQFWNVEGEMPLSVSPDGRFIGSVGNILSAEDGATVCRTIVSLPFDVESHFTPDSRLIGLVGSPTGRPNYRDGYRGYYAPTRLRFWHTDTGKFASDFSFTRVRAFDLTHDSHSVVMACDSGTSIGGEDGSALRRIDLTTGKVLWERERSMNGPSPDPDAVLVSLVLSPNGKYIVAQSFNSHLIVLDTRTGQELFRPFVRQQQGDQNWFLPGGVAFSADGHTLVSRCGTQVLVWDASVLQ